MVKIPHTLKFETILDETHPVAIRLLSLSNAQQVEMLEGMLKALLVPLLQPEIDKINERSSYALLTVVK